jgi:hypothetical protein
MRTTITEAEKAEIEAAQAIPKREERWPVLAALIDRHCPFMREADYEMAFDEIASALLAHAEVEPEPFTLPAQAGVLEIRSGDGAVLASKPLYGDELAALMAKRQREILDYTAPPGMTAE